MLVEYLSVCLIVRLSACPSVFMFVADAAFYSEAFVVAKVAAAVVVTAVAAGIAHDFSMSSFVKGTSTLGCL